MKLFLVKKMVQEWVFHKFFGLKETIDLMEKVENVNLMFSFLRPFIFNLDPEKAHDLAIKSLKYNVFPKKFIYC